MSPPALRMRNPILVLASFNTQEGNAIELAENDNCAVPQGEHRPPIDLTKNQSPFWNGAGDAGNGCRANDGWVSGVAGHL